MIEKLLYNEQIETKCTCSILKKNEQEITEMHNFTAQINKSIDRIFNE